MPTAKPTLAKPILIACAWTVLVEAVGLWLASDFGIDCRLAGLSLVPGWLPIVAVAVRRPSSPTTSDLVVMFTSYPVLYVAITALSRWCL